MALLNTRSSSQLAFSLRPRQYAPIVPSSEEWRKLYEAWDMVTLKMIPKMRKYLANGQPPFATVAVGILLFSEVLLHRTQALAGAIFNTTDQSGQTIGLALIEVVSDSETQDRSMPNTLFTCTGLMVLPCFIGVRGLRTSGANGLKWD